MVLAAPILKELHLAAFTFLRRNVNRQVPTVGKLHTKLFRFISYLPIQLYDHSNLGFYVNFMYWATIKYNTEYLSSTGKLFIQKASSAVET